MVTTNRWDNYFLKKDDDFITFWHNYLNDNKSFLTIAGIGFDPRSVECIKKIFDKGSGSKKTFKFLSYYNDSTKMEGKYYKRVEKNRNAIVDFVNKLPNTSFKFHDLTMKSEENKNICGLNSTKIVKNYDDIKNYTDIIVDISAMPKLVFFPLINKLLSLIDNHNNRINLHVVATENFYLDSIILDEGLEEESTYMQGFGNIELARTSKLSKVWIPILGENQKNQIDIIRKTLKPDETSPVLPFPSRNPRRGDDLLLENYRIFFDDLRIESKNIIYVDEQNPFQVYRILNQSINRYVTSFEIIKGCKIIISSLSSKLISVGTLLSAYENRKDANRYIGVMHVEANDHKIEGGEAMLDNYTLENTFFELWLTGEPYIE